MTTNDFVGLNEGVGKAIDAAAKAIELAPDLAEGHTAMARILIAYKLDMAGGRKAMETALELNPGNVEVQIEFSRMNALFGRSEPSVAAAEKALELDPVSMNASVFLGRALYEARRYDEAIAVFRHVLELDPHHARPHYGIAMCQFLQGDLAPALEEVEQEPLGWMKHSGMAIILHHLGNTEEAEAALALLIETYGDNGVYQRAQVHAQRSDADQAIQDLHRSLEIGAPGFSQLLVDPLVDPIRDDPRFIELMERTGFAAL